MRRITKLFIAITVLIAAVLLYLTPIFIPQAKEEELKTAPATSPTPPGRPRTGNSRSPWTNKAAPRA